MFLFEANVDFAGARIGGWRLQDEGGFGSGDASVFIVVDGEDGGFEGKSVLERAADMGPVRRSGPAAVAAGLRFFFLLSCHQIFSADNCLEERMV